MIFPVALIVMVNIVDYNAFLIIHAFRLVNLLFLVPIYVFFSQTFLLISFQKVGFCFSLTCSVMQVVASYFPLHRCIEGLKVLVQSLFGATFCSVPLAPGESWHPNVLKMSLHHPEEVLTWMATTSVFFPLFVKPLTKCFSFASDKN